MKILMFSSDRGAMERMRRYGEALEKLEIVFFDRGRGRFSRFWKGYFEAKRILSQEKFDLITAQEIEHSFLAWLLSRKFKIPWQLQIHTDIFSPYYVQSLTLNRVRVRLAKFLIPRANCVRVVSERIKKSINRPDAIVLPIFFSGSDQPAGLDIGGLDIGKKYPGYDFYILMVGRLAREKNFKLALEVMREVVKKSNALLIIVGNGPELGNIKNQISNLKINENVKLEGWQSEVGGYYKSADCFLLTSDYEGYGMAAVEALQNGLPVIMSDVGVANDVIKDGSNGLIVPVGDRDGFIKAITKIMRDSNLKSRLQGGAQHTKLPYASFDDYREKLINSWKKCA